MISVDPNTNIIFVPKADLTLVQSSPTEVRELNLNTFRSWLNDWQSSEDGITMPKTHNHNTEVYLSGLTFARVIEILDPYSITFEDGQYAVNLIGANSNVSDKVNTNQVSIRTFNSAGLISSPDIEYASFQQAVWIDPLNGNDDNKGNAQYPVKTSIRALEIANYRGFKKFQILNDIAVISDISGFELIGHSSISTVIYLVDIAETSGIRISNAVVAGILDGETEIHDCIIKDLVYINGYLTHCAIDGTFVLGGGIGAVLDSCLSIGHLTPPTIDMNVGGQNLFMTNYSGTATIINLSDPDIEIIIGLESGKIILDSTITAGKIHISGTGILVDNTTGTATVDSSGLTNNETVAKSVWSYTQDS